MEDYGSLEEYGYNNYPTVSSTPRLKTPINLSALANSTRSVFEIDTDQSLQLLDDEEDFMHLEENPEDQPVTETNPKAYAAKNKKKPFALDPNSDLSFAEFYDPEFLNKMESVGDGAVKKIVIKNGSGRKVPDACKVFVHYILCAEGEDEPLDSTIDRGWPACLDFREGGTIAGIYVAVKAMCLFEVSKIWIRYDYAYGALGCPPRIPPATNVHCLIEVLDVIEEDKLKLIPFMSSYERQGLEFKQIHDTAIELRKKGNGYYKDQLFWDAIKNYRKALGILEEYATINEDDQYIRQEAVFTLYQNLAGAYLQVNRPQQVCVCCHLALRSKQKEDKTFCKLYYRFAEAKFKLGHTDEAIRLNNEAFRREPKDSKILEQKSKLMERTRQENEISKLTFSKMGSMFNNNTTKLSEINEQNSSTSEKGKNIPQMASSSKPVKSSSHDKAVNEKQKVKQPSDLPATKNDSSSKESISKIPNTNDKKAKAKPTLKMECLEWEEQQSTMEDFKNDFDSLQVSSGTSTSYVNVLMDGGRKMEVGESHRGLSLKKESNTLYDLLEPKLNGKQ